MRTLIIMFVFFTTTVFANKMTNHLFDTDVYVDLVRHQVNIEEDVVTPIKKDGREVFSYLIEKKDGKKLIIGITDPDIKDPGKPKLISGIINAYAGYQTVFGIHAGLELLKRVEIGVHYSTTGAGFIFDPINKKGVHLNFHIIKNVDSSIYIGSRYNDFHKIDNDYYGDYTEELKGNTLELLLGANAFIDRRQSVGIEIGYERDVGDGLGNYEYGVNLLEDGVKINRPVFRLKYSVRLFKR